MIDTELEIHAWCSIRVSEGQRFMLGAGKG